jgi:hypothetical protein
MKQGFPGHNVIQKSVQKLSLALKNAKKCKENKDFWLKTAPVSKERHEIESLFETPEISMDASKDMSVTGNLHSRPASPLTSLDSSSVATSSSSSNCISDRQPVMILLT